MEMNNTKTDKKVCMTLDELSKRLNNTYQPFTLDFEVNDKFYDEIYDINAQDLLK